MLLELPGLEGSSTMRTLELEVAVSAAKQLAKPLPKAKHYSTFEALESFASIGDGLSGLLP